MRESSIGETLGTRACTTWSRQRNLLKVGDVRACRVDWLTEPQDRATAPRGCAIDRAVARSRSVPAEPARVSAARTQSQGTKLPQGWIASAAASNVSALKMLFRSASVAVVSIA